MSFKDIWRQIDEFKLLDKVLLDPNHTVGCYVQLEDQSLGVTKSVKLVKSAESETSKLFSQVAKGVLQEKSGEEAKCESSKLKYLARAYICRIAELNTDRMSPNLLQALKLTAGRNPDFPV